MRTELIYSKNRHEDIERAMERITLFRAGYRDLIETRAGRGTPYLHVLRNRLRGLFMPGRYRDLAMYDALLEASLAKLKELQELVEISNMLQDTYRKYHGKMDIRVKPKGKKEYLLQISTSGYSDDLEGGGSVRIPSLKREYRISEQTMERTFSMGAVDFSWLDGELTEITSAYTEPPALPDKKSSAVQAASAPELHFSSPGDNPVDILE